MSLQLTLEHEKTEDEDEGEGCRRDRTPDRA
jgi:hypothetical protein